MKIGIKPWVLGIVLFVLLALAAENVYFSYVMSQQQHTIRQFMGLEDGPDATPQPPSLPAYVPPVDQRSI